MKKKLYSTLVIDASRNKSGGAIAYLKNFIKHLNLKNTKIKKIIIFSQKSILNQIPNKSFVIKYSHPFLEMNIFFQIIWQLIILPIYLKKNKIDILYSTDSSTFCNFSPSIVFNQDILSFDKNTLNNMPLSIAKIRLYLIRFIQIRSMNNAEVIIFLSKYSKNVISKYLKKNINYNIIYHGIEKDIKTLGKKNTINTLWDYKLKKKIKIVYVSPLFHYKNHISVVKAYSRLKKKYNNLDIKFIGKYKHNLKMFKNILSENSSIDKSNFTGELNRKDVLKILTQSDIFVFASSSETFGITLLEGMAIGMPIVCSNKSSLPEILDNGGIYFDPKNDLQLFKKIDLLIRNKKLRKTKSEQSKKIALKFSWENNTNQFCNLINNLIEN